MKHAPILLFALLVGCGGAASGVTSGQPPTSTYCASLAPPQLLYPAPGSTSVQTNAIYVGYGSLSTLQGTWSAPYLAAGNTVTQGGPWLAPSPSPSNPPGTPLPAGDVYGVSSVASLSAASTYYVSVQNLQCPGSTVLGSFTTK